MIFDPNSVDNLRMSCLFLDNDEDEVSDAEMPNETVPIFPVGSSESLNDRPNVQLNSILKPGLM